MAFRRTVEPATRQRFLDWLAGVGGRLLHRLRTGVSVIPVGSGEPVPLPLSDAGSPQQCPPADRPLDSPGLIAAPTGRFTEGHLDRTPPRRFMLYEPDRRLSGPAPLLVMLHGCHQGAQDFAVGTRMNEAADTAGVLVLYPEQPAAANVMRCWNWYALQDRSNPAGDAALIVAMTRQVMRAHDIDPTRIYVAGMSAGGAMAAILARDYPRLFAALGVHSGVPAGQAHDVFAAMRLMSNGPLPPGDDLATHADDIGGTVPSIVFHGDEDTAVHPANGQAIHLVPRGVPVDQAPLGSLQTTSAAAEGRHGYTRSVDHGMHGVTDRELWIVHGAGHAWFGGSAQARHTDPNGPDASREMLRFFLQHRLAAVPHERPVRPMSFVE